MALFSQYVQEQLRYYVYLLSDPMEHKIFYVGKGTGNRVFAHAKAALALEDQRPSDKLDRIREIRRHGLEVEHELLRFGLVSEAAAYEVEAAAIQLLGLDDLANIVAGHHIGARGRMSTEVAASLFEAPPVGPISESALLIKIPQMWHPAMPPADLYEATRGWWRISKRRDKAAFACAVSRGVIREIYAISGWSEYGPGDRGWVGASNQYGRVGFTGPVADDLDQYRNKSVKHLYKPGEASPIKFINC